MVAHLELRTNFPGERAMKNRKERIGSAVLFLLVILLVFACGGVDAEAPAMSPVSEDEVGESDADGKADRLQEIQESEESEDGEGRGEEPLFGETEGEEIGEEEEEDEDRCRRICFKLSWCNEEGVDLAACVASCEEVEYSGIVKEDVFTCLDDASSCVEAGRCEDRIEICSEVCGVYNYCGYEDDGRACMEWCSAKIWNGIHDWNSQFCVESKGAQGLCGEVESCGLGWRESDQEWADERD